MKKWYAGLLVAFSVMLMAGCGQKGAEQAEGADASGGVVVLEESSRTEGMNQENEAAQEMAAEEQTADKQKEEGKTSDPNVNEGQVIVAPEELVEPEIAPPTVAEEIPREPTSNNLHIVFLGDSILDGYRDHTGIAYQTGLHCGADVYNLAMGGTTAALTTYEKSEYEKWDSRCLQGVVHVLCGNVNSSLLDGFAAAESYAACDIENTDYFVIEYGMNDFLSAIPLNDMDDYYDEYTYVGALRIAVSNLRDKFPNATIVLCAPNYAHFWGKDGAYLGDGNMTHNGVGTLVEYVNVCENVAHDMNTLFLDAYRGIGLDAYTADEYLEDGIHLSEKGRAEYARILSEIIMEHEQTKNN